MAAVFDLLEAATMNYYNFPPNNPNTFDPLSYSNNMSLQVSDYIDEGQVDGDFRALLDAQTPESSGSSFRKIDTPNTFTGSTSKRMKAEGGRRIGFRTKSDVDVLDDGYKWRKYGKKSVKNSPNPRNYYKCSCEGCPVKKRVERDREEPSYVLTTYDGVHNHTIPGAVCFQTMIGDHGRSMIWANSSTHMDPNSWSTNPGFQITYS